MRNEGGSGLCAGFCASSSVHTEKLLFRDWDQHAEHCRYCRRCCLEQFEVWPLGSSWCISWPRSCRSEVVPRKNFITKKAVKGTPKRWFGAETVASTAVGETASWTTVCISDVVDVGDVQNDEEHDQLFLLCCSWSASSPRKCKKGGCQWIPVLQKKQFSVESPSASRLHLSLLSRLVSRSWVREEVAMIAVMSQYSTGDINNNLIAYMYRLLAFEIRY